MPIYLETGTAQLMHVRPDGDDELDGLTWPSAKRTIQAAHDALPAQGANPGGLILLSEGEHAAGAVITTPGVEIVGLSRRATRIAVGPDDDFGIHFLGNYTTGGVRDLKVASTSEDVSHGGILIDVAENIVLERVVFQDFGRDVAPSTAFDLDEGPYGLKVRGDSSNSFSDWHEFVSCEWFQCFRAFVAPGGGQNGKFLGGTMRDVGRSAVHLRRQHAGGASSGPQSAQYWFFGVYMKSSFQTEPNYLVQLDADPGLPSHGMGARFIGCETEIVNPDVGHHFSINVASAQIDDHAFVGGRASQDGGAPHAVRFGPLAERNTVGQYLLSDQGAGDPIFVQEPGASGNLVWRRSTAGGQLSSIGGFYSEMSSES